MFDTLRHDEGRAYQIRLMVVANCNNNSIIIFCRVSSTLQTFLHSALVGGIDHAAVYDILVPVDASCKGFDDLKTE